MAKSVEDLVTNFKIENDVITTKWNDCDINIKGYLEIEQKRQMIDWIISQCRRNKTGFLNAIDLDKKWDIALVNYYTDFKFNIVNKDCYNQIYDTLNTNHFFDMLVTSIPEKEYNLISDKFQEEVEKDNEYQKTLASNITRFIEELKETLINSEETLKQFKDFDISKFDNIANIADKLGKNNSVKISTVEKKDK